MRLIDADALFEDCLFSSPEFELGLKEFINDAPTIDAVPVVRCRDCKYSDAEDLNISSQQGHMEKRYIRFCKCDSPILVVADMHFCSCGEREDDADN